GRGQHLALFLERAHAVAVGLRRTADQEHWPAVLLGIGKPGEAVDDTRPGDRDARARTAGQKADRARGIRCRLLVAHADIGQAHLLRRVGDWADGKPDDAEHVLYALLLEALRQQVGALDFSHNLLPSGKAGPAATLRARPFAKTSFADYAFIAGGGKRVSAGAAFA